MRFDEEDAQKENEKCTLGTSLMFSPSSNKRKLKTAKKPIQTMLNDYIGFHQGCQYDLDNYDNQASTPRKKLKLH